MPRQLFEIYIRGSERYELAGTLSNASLALDFCKAGKVDLVLMDVCTALGSNGLDAAEEIKQEFPQIKVIIVTSIPEFSWMERARAAGVESFWYKNLMKEPLLDLMDRIMAGESIYPDEPPEVQLGQASSHSLTKRELAVLQKLTTGASNEEIAAELGISAITVRNHIHSMMEKTGYHSRTELAVNARAKGLAIGDL